MSDFKQQLAKQLGFLERSAKLYDDGHIDEAFRIATGLRVIFHQTASSTSLLTHLGSPAIKMRSTVPDMSDIDALRARGKVAGELFVSLASITLTTGPKGGRLAPKNETQDHDRMIPWDDWWSERFASINNHDYHRRSLVLWACNKDGGAHVDEVFPAQYRAIVASAAVGVFYQLGQTHPIENAHMVFLRSMAFEALNSADLVSLAS